MDYISVTVQRLRSMKPRAPPSHEALMTIDAAGGLAARSSRVRTVAVCLIGVDVVGQIHFEDLMPDPLHQARALHGKHDLDPVVEIAQHQIRTAQEDLFAASIAEVIDARMLQESADHAGNPDAVADPGTPGRRQHNPRTSRSTCTPACDAR